MSPLPTYKCYQWKKKVEKNIPYSWWWLLRLSGLTSVNDVLEMHWRPMFSTELGSWYSLSAQMGTFSCDVALDCPWRFFFLVLLVFPCLSSLFIFHAVRMFSFPLLLICHTNDECHYLTDNFLWIQFLSTLASLRHSETIIWAVRDPLLHSSKEATFLLPPVVFISIS